MKATPCADGLFHYEVLSPEVSVSSSWEPPDSFRCWGVYLARSAKAARVLAVKDPEFDPWVKEARADGTPPFKMLEARRFVCEHGVCVQCEADEADDHACGYACDECDRLAEETDRLEVAAGRGA